jgi:hypothetical protein
VKRLASETPPPLELEADTERPAGDRTWAERLLWTLVGAAIVNWSVSLLGPASYFGSVAVIMVLAGFWGVCVCVVSWLPSERTGFVERYSTGLAWLTAILLVCLFGAWAFTQIHNQPNYGTDELTFDQYAALLARHGLNPYTHSMAPAPSLYRLSPQLFSYTLTGTAVEQLSYPSLSFLLYVPFMLLGWQNQVGAGVNVIAWGITILLMFKLLPRDLRAMALVLGSFDAYTSFAAGGVTDMLYIPLLILAAYRWDRFGQGWRTYMGPVALGLAMGIKQTPWPVLVFVVLALAYDEYDRSGVKPALGRAGRYLAAVATAFLVPNLPYILASPSAWITGVTTPFVKNLVPSGQGLVALTLFVHAGGGSLTIFTIAAALVFVLIVVAFVGTYPLLRPATFLLPTFAYFFAARSQTNYLISLIPVAVVGAVTAGSTVAPALRVEERRGEGRALPFGKLLGGRRFARLQTGRALGPARSAGWAGAIATALALALAATAYSVTAPSPLKITIEKFRTTGFVSTIDQLALRVVNSSGNRAKPSFTVQTSRGYTTFWNVITGPKSLAPHEVARYVIGPPNAQSEPGLSDGFSVVAFTQQPDAVSVSNRFLLNLWSTEFSPQAVNAEIPAGERVRVQVQVVDHYNDPVERSGIAVHVTQLVYGGLGVRHPVAVINGSPPGSPATAYTNSHGIATFYIVDNRTRSIPVTFSAHLINRPGQYVYGSAGYLNIRFAK